MSETPGQNGGGNGNGRARWAGIAVTVGMAIAALIVQWGVVTTKLDQVEKRLDELIVEARTLRLEYQAVERRVSYIEGRLNGAGGHTGGNATAGRVSP